MCPILLEIGPLPAWVAVALATTLGAAALLIELREQRRAGAGRDWPRALGIAGVAALTGVALWWGLRRWGPVQVRAWGTMLMVGFMAAMLWALWDGRDDEEITLNLMIDLTLVILVGAIIGARALSVILEWSSYAAHPGAIWRVWEGGLSFHGGLIGGTLAGSWLTWRRGLSVPRMADRLMPAVAIGYALTRIGCFLNGCCYGAPTDSALGVHFHFAGEPDIARHPTQLYSAALSLLIFAILLAVRARLRRPGHLALLYVIIYSAGRFGIEHFRRGASAVVYQPLAPLTYAQVGSILLALLAGACMAIDAARAQRRAGGEPPPEGRTSGPAGGSDND